MWELPRSNPYAQAASRTVTSPYLADSRAAVRRCRRFAHRLKTSAGGSASIH